MSWPAENVPEGWTRGEPIQWYGGGPRYAVYRVLNPLPLLVGTVLCEDEVALVFDSAKELEAFLDWWRA